MPKAGVDAHGQMDRHTGHTRKPDRCAEMRSMSAKEIGKGGRQSFRTGSTMQGAGGWEWWRGGVNFVAKVESENFHFEGHEDATIQILTPGRPHQADWWTDGQMAGKHTGRQKERQTDGQADKLDRLSISATVGCAFAEAQSGNRTPYRADMLDKAGRKWNVSEHCKDNGGDMSKGAGEVNWQRSWHWTAIRDSWQR